MKSKIIGSVFIGLAIIIVVFVAYQNSVRRQVPLVFSPRVMLNSVWEQYKKEYLEQDTYRTLDKQRENITTSEGQSYTMLRAVWLDDKETFDKSWQWTKNNLQRDEDHLFSWLFGKRPGPGNQYGVLTDQGGYNTASDADTDIALALLFAYARWNDEKYLRDAQPIINDIWEKEVVVIKGKPYLAANNIEKTSDKNEVIVNPSYLAPYAYRVFAKVDKKHAWNDLVTTSYEVIEKSMDATLDKSGTVRLPPNWISIDRKTAEIKPASVSNLDTNFSYDALRVPWRLSLDLLWNNEARAERVLTKLSFLSEEWQKERKLYLYTHDGVVLSREESPALYGGSIGYFLLHKPSIAEEVYIEKLQILYDPDKQSWKKPLSYYDDNWAWFGIALYNNALPNLRF